MGFILEALGGATGLVTKAAGWVGEKLGGVKAAVDLLPDSPEKAAVKLETAKAEHEFALGMAALETERAKSLDQLRIAEAKSENWLTANHRPLAVLALIGIVVLIYGLVYPVAWVLCLTGAITADQLAGFRDPPYEFWILVGGLTGIKFVGRERTKQAKIRAGL